jgi:hypothetical protein
MPTTTPTSKASKAARAKWPFAIADLDDAPLILTLAEVAAIYRMGVSTIQKQCARGTFHPEPYARNPSRWRKADILRDLAPPRRGRPPLADKAARRRKRRPS